MSDPTRGGWLAADLNAALTPKTQAQITRDALGVGSDYHPLRALRRTLGGVVKGAISFPLDLAGMLTAKGGLADVPGIPQAALAPLRSVVEEYGPGYRKATENVADAVGGQWTEDPRTDPAEAGEILGGFIDPMLAVRGAKAAVEAGAKLPAVAERLAAKGAASSGAIRRKVATAIAPELTQELRAAARAAETDALTGVANRAALDKALPTAERDANMAVLAFDANNFGHVNKTAGHEAGDEMLRRMSQSIQQAAAEHGVGGRVFRRGGDEFVVLAPKPVADQLRQRAEQLFGAHPVGDRAVSLSGHVGDTFQAADAGLQAAKDARKAALSPAGGAQASRTIAASPDALPGPAQPYRRQFLGSRADDLQAELGYDHRFVNRAGPGNFTGMPNTNLDAPLPGPRAPYDGPAAATPKPAPPDPEAVRAWARDTKLRHSLDNFDVNVSQDGSLVLNMMSVGKESRGQGYGSRAVQQLVEYADKHGLRVKLTPASKDPNFGTTSRGRLVKFYKRFGFRENKGRAKDFTIGASEMYREPVAPGAEPRIQVIPGGVPYDGTEVDDYLYHVTSKPNAQRILREGLLPNRPGTMGRFNGYDAHSAGRVFFTERGGVPFWANRVEDHLFDAFDNPPDVAVLRMRRADLGELQPDPLGTRDAHAPSYFNTTGFPLRPQPYRPR